MPPKPAFTEAQFRILRDTAKKVARKFKNQDEFALALGITQPSISALLRGKWRPGVTTAKAIAHLEQTTLEELVGPYGDGKPASSTPPPPPITSAERFPNLEACVRFYAGTRTWRPWTLAAARAGIWGDDDMPPPAWAAKLDTLEKALDAARDR